MLQHRHVLAGLVSTSHTAHHMQHAGFFFFLSNRACHSRMFRMKTLVLLILPAGCVLVVSCKIYALDTTAVVCADCGIWWAGRCC